MLKQHIRLHELCQRFEEALIRKGHGDYSLYQYRSVLRQIKKHCGDVDYSPEMCAEFLQQKIESTGGFKQSGKYSKLQMYYIRTVRALEEYDLYGCFFRRKGKNMSEKFSWPLQFKPAILAFLDQLAARGISEHHQVRYAATIQSFLIYLNKSNVKTFSDVTPAQLSGYIVSLAGYAPRTVQTFISILRGFFRYLYLNEHTQTALYNSLPKVQTAARMKLPTTWKQDDIQKILKVIDLGNPIGKRDYAIILLVAKTGLRIGDVVNLKLSDIDWDKEEIAISQDKTGKPLRLPLLPDVGWAIIEYLKHGRPITEYKNVFLRHLAPFEPMSGSAALYGRLTQYISKAGLPVENKEKIGMHSLRHSLACELLQNHIPLDTIADILGHETPETTKHYLKVNMEALRKCTLQIAGDQYEA